VIALTYLVPTASYSYSGAGRGGGRHRLSRAGNRRMNHMIHTAVISQIRLDTDGRVYYRRKRAEGKKPLEAIRCLKRRISDAIYRQLIGDAQRATSQCW
jgi:transposase